MSEVYRGPAGRHPPFLTRRRIPPRDQGCPPGCIQEFDQLPSRGLRFVREMVQRHVSRRIPRTLLDIASEGRVRIHPHPILHRDRPPDRGVEGGGQEAGEHRQRDRRGGHLPAPHHRGLRPQVPVRDRRRGDDLAGRQSRQGYGPQAQLHVMPRETRVLGMRTRSLS